MSRVIAGLGTSRARWGISGLTLFKSFVYGSLCYSSSQFIYEDFVAASLLLNGESSAADILNIFSVTIDTVSWLLLLVIFELETSVLSDDRLRGRIRWLLNGIIALCYAVIVYAFTGYVGKLLMLAGGSAMEVTGLCQMLGQNLVVMVDMDEYEALSAANCAGLAASEPIGQIEGTPIIYEQSIYGKIMGLATVAAINSGAWILVVAILQFDVVMQLRGGLNKRLSLVSGVAKILLYVTLVIVALYWGIVGDFVDFWDAFMWLLGFFLIELNLLNWQQETHENSAALTD